MMTAAQASTLRLDAVIIDTQFTAQPRVIAVDKDTFGHAMLVEGGLILIGEHGNLLMHRPILSPVWTVGTLIALGENRFVAATFEDLLYIWEWREKRWQRHDLKLPRGRCITRMSWAIEFLMFHDDRGVKHSAAPHNGWRSRYWYMERADD